VPRSRFRPAPDLWRALRSGEIDAARCGLSVAGITGTWFPAGSVLRHAAALAMVETLPLGFVGPGARVRPHPDGNDT
jgi:hypothetical protein